MKHLFGFSEAFILALHAMAMLCGNTDKLVSTNQIASKLNASEHHLSKVMQRLSKTGLISAVRGPNGGFRLDKKPGEITIAEIYEAIEGPLEFNLCLMGEPVCKGEKCILDSISKSISNDVQKLFRTTRLSSLTDVMQ
jgi:Rrf2 family protein